MTSTNITARFMAAESAAAHGSGQSDVLYEAKIRSAYSAILAAASDADRGEVEAALRARCFEPDAEAYAPGAGECALTGIEVDRCPCGRHA